MNTPTLFSNSSAIRKPVLILSMAGLLSLSQFSFAAGSCKGLQQDACSSDSSCSWINSYTTKKGKTINAYCRNKPKASSNKAVPDSSRVNKSDKQG